MHDPQPVNLLYFRGRYVSRYTLHGVAGELREGLIVVGRVQIVIPRTHHSKQEREIQVLLNLWNKVFLVCR